MTKIKPEEISRIISNQLIEPPQVFIKFHAGTVLQVGDGIARIHGLNKAMAGELLEF